MKRFLPLLSVLLVSAPAFGQTHVYTNADLGKPLVRTITPEAALETWLTHTGGVPPEIVIDSQLDGPQWIEGPRTEWTATLSPNAPLAQDSGVCYGCYGGYGGYGGGYGDGYIPGYGGGYWPGGMSQGFGIERFGPGHLGGPLPPVIGGPPPPVTAPDPAAFVGRFPRRPAPSRPVVINPPAAVRLPATARGSAGAPAAAPAAATGRRR